MSNGSGSSRVINSYNDEKPSTINNNSNNNNNNDNSSYNNVDKNRRERLFTEVKSWVPSNHQLSSDILKLTDNIKFSTGEILENFNNKFNYKTLNLNSVKYDSIKLCEKDNLSREERDSLYNLKNNNSIVIKPADKGGATVLMNKTNYILEAERQLSDEKYYIKLKNPIFTNNVPKIKLILTNMLRDNFINKEQYEYLAGPELINNRTFYLLPKIHKKPESWPQPGRMPPGRPIVSDVGSETYRISEYIDYYLNPLACKHNSYIKNTYEFVEKIKNFAVNNNYLLVTGDVESLYTNMNLNRSINCVKDIFNKFNDPKRPDNYLLELLEISLKNNDFEFNGEFYLQTMGCAMGKRFAPALANIYLLDFDNKAQNDFKIKPILYFRFLDDIFFLWPCDSISLLLEYEMFLNSLIPDIRIKLEYNNNEIPFLDTLIYKQDNTLQTRTYFKPTDTHQLLHSTSFHAKHTFNGLLKSQLIRFKRLSSNRRDYNNTCKTLFAVLITRGYNLSIMRKLQHNIWFNYADNTAKNNPNDSFIPIITDFSKLGIRLANEYKKCLRENERLKNFKLITAYKNSKNLKQLLVRSKLKTIDSKDGTGFVCCGQSRCLTCRYHTADATHFYNKTNKEHIIIKDTIYCHSKNLIYLITCTKCQKQYVGETERSIRDRATDHRSCIKNKKQTPIGVHFNEPGHSFLNMKITPIELIHNTSDPTKIRKIREKFWQIKLKTEYPTGLNNLPVNNNNHY